MTDYRHSGMGWSNGAVRGGNGNILALPSPDLLMLGSEHWHHDEAVRAGKRVLFRGMARKGFHPAELGWDVSRYVDEILRDAVRVTEPITDFVAWNEWNLQDERGDQRPDHGNLTALFTLLGGFQYAVLAELRKRAVTRRARLHFGAWAPKDETDYVQHWRAAAELADIVDVHAYGHGTGIVGHTDKYRALFPGKPIQITEWHSWEDRDGVPVQTGDDRETLALFANEAAVYPDFRAYYFLWRWDSPPAHQRGLADAIAVEGNPDRLALFRDPPVVTRVPEPTPEPEPEMPDYRAYAREAAGRAGIDPELFVRQIQQESGFNPAAYNPSGATGIAQIIPRFHPSVDPTDPIASLEYAAQWMGRLYRQYGSYAKALMAYNWGPGNVQNWNGQPSGMPAETRHYLDVILGAGWPEPGGSPMPEIKLSDVLARGRSRIGDPYVWGGKEPPNTDCSGFAAWCYQGRITSFTDAVLGETERVASPAPGDIVLYEYADPGQPGVRFPHMGLFISDGVVLDNRFGAGVGEHPQLPRSSASRYYRRLPGVIVDTDGSVQPPAPAPAPPTDELAALRAENERLRTVLGYSTGDIVNALQKEADAIMASAGALSAAINTLRNQK